jgi:hypothetical protein
MTKESGKMIARIAEGETMVMEEGGAKTDERLQEEKEGEVGPQGNTDGESEEVEEAEVVRKDEDEQERGCMIQ